MQITATLVQLLPLQTGEGRNGPWKKQEIIVETDGQYPKKICISIWGDKIIESVLQVGHQLTISFDLESREFNSRWYTDVKAWKVEPGNSSNTNTNSQQTSADNSSNEPSIPTDTGDDLPF
ncbi:MAG: DUF3127 domain-containing protein [Sphingobacteriales bacterium]|nr:DUF3127 domain-containing protein [Sphingobacteriales bacterium]